MNKERDLLTPEQSQVVDYIDGNILVSASAGSGKTHTMTQKILKLVCEQGVNIDEILAVTFTEASATDMREKIRKAIAEKIESVVGTDEKLAKKLSEQLKELPTADVSTMHGFCGRLIRTYFYEVGVSPDFKILDKSSATAIRQEAINKTFSELYASDPDFTTLVARYSSKRSDKKLKELILDIYAYADSEAYPEKLLDKYTELYSEQGVNKLNEIYKRAVNVKLNRLLYVLKPALDEVREQGLKKATEFISTLVSDILGAINCDVYQFKAKYKDYKINLSYETKLDDGQKETKETVKIARDKLTKKIITSALKGIRDTAEEEIENAKVLFTHTELLVRVIKRFTEVYANEKREENALDFNDLEHFALKILSNTDICKAVKERYEYIFVDEYQDTNGVQDEIVSAIQDGNLLMVGDVKQSIYGFRGCRSEFFSRKDKLMQENGEKVVRLNKNFRSSQNVINAVNSIFNYSMTEEYYGESYLGTSELIFGGGYPDGAEGRAELHRLITSDTDTPKEEPRIYDLLKAVSKDQPTKEVYTAALLKKIIDDELGKEYYDVKSNSFKRVSYGDIAILTRAKDSPYVTALVNELTHRYGVPISTMADEPICEYPEIKTLINALKAVDCFKWDLPLASTLKSPIGGFTDEELFEIAGFYGDEKGKHNDNFYDAYAYYLDNAKTQLRDKLKAFDDYFAELRFSADFIGASGVLKKLVADKNLLAYAYAQKGGTDKVARINKLLSASSANGNYFTVREFLKRVEVSPEELTVSRAGGENAVTAMTIHASKGLEYPVVIVCGLERSFNKDDEGEPVLLSREYGLATKYYDDQTRTADTTLLRRLTLAEIDEQTMKEETRLFYVATTRAKYSLHLVFAGEDKRKYEFDGANCFLDLIPAYMPVTEHNQNDFTIEADSDTTETLIVGDGDANLARQMREIFDFEYPFREDVNLPIKSTVTDVNAKQKSEFYDILKIFSETDGSKTNATLGTNAHRLLELLDFNKRNDFKGEVSSMLKNGLITADVLEGLDIDRLSKTVAGNAFDCTQGKELFREKSFILNVPANLILDTDSETEVLVQGVIDLLVLDGQNATVIDYKYSSLSEDSLKEKYHKQLTLYAYAVEKCLGVKVKDKIIVSLLTGNTVNID